MSEVNPFFQREAANEAPPTGHSSQRPARERTVPIPETLTPVPGYPQKLAVFKMAASRYWQVRCWMAGRTYRRSTQTQSLRMAQSFARQFYEQLMAQRYTEVSGQGPLFSPASAPKRAAGQAAEPAPAAACPSFGALASQVLTNEQARSARGEYSVGSYQVLCNRLDAHILPRWGEVPANAINFQALLEFTHFLSQRFSTTTVSQYLVAVRKVLQHGVSMGVLMKVPEFPKIKIVTTPRGAFTPSEYWQIIRAARRMRGQQYPAPAETIRTNYKIRVAEQRMPPDLAWAIAFMLNSFIRPSDLKTLQHRHVEIVRANNTYLRLTLPETKSHGRPIVTMYPAVRCYQQICKQQTQTGHGAPDDYLFLPAIKDRNYAHWVLSFHFTGCWPKPA